MNSYWMDQFKANWKVWLVGVILFLIASIPLTWASTSFRSLDGWPAIVLVGLLSIGMIWLGWRLLAAEQPPAWLRTLVIAAAILHLVVGVSWLVLLPQYGHGNRAESEGYVMGDAYARDTVAWRLARSQQPLWSAFSGNRRVDQYGGLLFLSGLIYRYLGSNFHQPLLMVMLAAAFSALSILFTWAFARLAWGPAEARLAAWLMLLYPEVIILGSSQMREAFTVTLVIAAFYGLLRYQRDRNWKALLYMLVPLFVCLPFSPLAAAMILGGLIVLAFSLRFSRRLDILSHRPFWIGLAGLVLVVLVGLYLGLRQFTPAKIDDPISMLIWWLNKSGSLQAYYTEHASGWLQKVADSFPGWFRLPMFMMYGILQPLLPAALIARSEAPVWYAIAVWRSVGWSLILPFLIYVPFLAARKKDGRAFNVALSLIIWTVILVSSFRGGADQWDNPRYRAMFAGLQAAMVAWVIIENRRMADPWLRRAVMAVGMVLLWFIPWYLRRYFGFDWPIVDPFKTLGLGLITGFLLIFWDWISTEASVTVPAGQRAQET